MGLLPPPRLHSIGCMLPLAILPACAGVQAVCPGTAVLALGDSAGAVQAKKLCRTPNHMVRLAAQLVQLARPSALPVPIL